MNLLRTRLDTKSKTLLTWISITGLANISCGQEARVNGMEDGSESVDQSESSRDSESDNQSSSGGDDNSGDDASSGEGSESNTEIEASDVFGTIKLSEHSKVKTLVVADWSQKLAAESVWLKFSFDDGQWLESPKVERKQGEQNEVLLGIPEGLVVDVQIVAMIEGKMIESDLVSTTNGMAPTRLPRPQVKSYDAALASENRWLLGNTVESRNNNNSYGGPNWNYIIDRQARVVWYRRAKGGDNGDRTAGFWPRISRDGTHITMDEQRRHRFADILRTTLDYAYEETIEIPGGLGDCYDITTDGSVLYDDRKSAFELTSGGEKRNLWKCDLGTGKWDCYSNTVNWDENSDSVLLSFPYKNTVVRLDRKTGDVLARWGQDGDWKFDPPSLGLGFNHWPNISPEGTFMVSSHSPGGKKGVMPHLFMEYIIDEANKTLKAKWIFGEGTEDWAQERGVVNRVEGGNAIANYGWGGVILEITPDNKVAWRVEHDVMGSGKKQRGKLLGNSILLNDLYAINRGPMRLQDGASASKN